jgi:hypothetical protein
VSDPPKRRHLQLVPQCAVAQQYIWPEQTFDRSQSTGGVAMVQTGADVDEGFRVLVCLVDRSQARQRGATQCGQQFLAADLGRVVVKRDEHPVHETDPVLGATALDGARIPSAVLDSPHANQRMPWYECRRDKRVQPAGVDQPGAEQLQVR